MAGGQGGGAVAPSSVGNPEIFGNSEISRKFFILFAFGTNYVFVVPLVQTSFIHRRNELFHLGY